MTVARVAGVPVRIHWSLTALLLVALGWVLRSGGLGAVPRAAFFAGAILTSVLVHELAHVLVARSLGIRAHQVVLYPFGGATQFAGHTLKPLEDVAISVAGPMASLALGFLAFASGWGLAWDDLATVGLLNVALGVFNLIPAMPMDGGRVLRALVVRSLGRRRGVPVVLVVGGVFTAVFVLLGLLLGDPGLLALAFITGLLQAREWQSWQAAYGRA